MKKILLVEDDPFLVDIYSSRLKSEGYKIDMAGDGELAVKKIKKEKPDILLLDMVLPKMDGWGVLREINENKELLKDMKIIILSNLGEQKEIERGLEMGSTAYIVKADHTPSETVEKIKKILN